MLEEEAGEVAGRELVVFPDEAEVALLLVIGDDDLDVGLAHEQLPQVREVVVVDGGVEFLDVGAKEGRVGAWGRQRGDMCGAAAGGHNQTRWPRPPPRRVPSAAQKPPCVRCAGPQQQQQRQTSVRLHMR